MAFQYTVKRRRFNGERRRRVAEWDPKRETDEGRGKGPAGAMSREAEGAARQEAAGAACGKPAGAMRRKPRRPLRNALAFAAALGLSAACFQAIPADEPAGLMAQSGALAAVAAAAMALSRPVDAGARPGDPLSEGVSPAPSRESWAVCGRLRPLVAWTAYVLAVGLASGIAFWLVGFAGVSAPAPVEAGGSLALRAAYVLALCVLTGVYEEGVFRVLALRAFLPHAGPVRAAVASAVLFGLLHGASADFAVAGVDGATVAVAGAQMVLKPVEAGLFGLFMAVLFLETGSFWAVALIHAAFDMLRLGPGLMGGALLGMHATGSAADLAVLAVAAALLAPPAAAALRALSRWR